MAEKKQPILIELVVSIELMPQAGFTLADMTGFMSKACKIIRQFF